jgi:3-hydroxyacyl-CoA dehydrogenase/enoyl-CoA hydratase/3-hydroxybutyryl-CoA epimerase
MNIQETTQMAEWSKVMSSIHLELKHFQLSYDDHGIAWLAFNKVDSKTNVLAQEVMQELEKAIGHFESSVPKGVVLYSVKSNGFMAGADINDFTRLQGEDEAYDYIRYSQNLFTRIEQLACPTLALIHGFCLGGGTELALSCRYRIACDDPKTRIGLPEVRLGIHPGFGGTVRLPPLVGPLAAMDMMLTGRALSARAAKRIGLVDYAVPERHFKASATKVILEDKGKHTPSWWLRFLNTKLCRPFLARMFKNKVAKKARRNHYPAPYAIIDLWDKYADDTERMMLEEARSEASLIVGDTAKNLIRAFFLQETLKTQGKQSRFRAEHVHVIGAGVMGGDIAAWCALKGLRVTLQDQAPERIAPAIKRAYQLFKRKLRKPRAIQAAMDNLIPDTKGFGVKQADVIIEAIFENKEAKQALYETLEPQMKPDALLTTNTSSIPLDELSTVLKDPNRLVGLHFFNPVAQMLLVEIVGSDNTYDESKNSASAFAQQIGKLPLPVRSTPGFLVNRVLMPYLLESVELMSEGVRPEVIDKVATDFGMPMGPVELADTVGLDICLSVAEILTSHLGGTVPDLLKQKVEQKELGRKSGTGFYRYQKGKPVKDKPAGEASADGSIEQRLISRLLNESMTCLREKVVEDADLLDAGIIFGTGFAPFRGGPMHYAETIGYAEQIAQFKQLERTYGDRFHPDDGWDSLEKAS